MDLRRNWSLLGLVAALLAGCGDGPGGPQAVEPGSPPATSCVPDPAFASDTTAPVVRRVFPEPIQNHDRDGDGLIDLELAFEDGEGGSGIDPATVTLEGPGGRDLLETWAVGELSVARLVVEETIAGLLPSGSDVPMMVTVSDRACNVGQTRIGVGLRPAALHTTIDVGDGDPGRELEDLVINPEGTRLYAVDQTAQITVVDPNAYRLIERIDGPVGDLHGITADWEANRLFAVGFAGPGLAEFDATTGQPIRRIETTQGAFTLAVSRRSSEIYIPLEEEFVATQGFLSVVDRSEGREVAVIEAGLPPRSDNGILGQHGAVLNDDESMLFVGTVAHGIHVWSPGERTWVFGIDAWPANPDSKGSVFDVDRQGDDVFGAVFRGTLPGGAIAHVRASTGELVRVLEAGRDTDISRMEISPDGKMLFVSGFGGRRPHDRPPNYLIDLDAFRIVQWLEGLGERFVYNDAAWHPDGRRVYVASTDHQSGNQIVVYLVRPDA